MRAPLKTTAAWWPAKDEGGWIHFNDLRKDLSMRMMLTPEDMVLFEKELRTVLREEEKSKVTR